MSSEDYDAAIGDAWAFLCGDSLAAQQPVSERIQAVGDARLRFKADRRIDLRPTKRLYGHFRSEG